MDETTWVDLSLKYDMADVETFVAVELYTATSGIKILEFSLS